MRGIGSFTIAILAVLAVGLSGCGLGLGASQPAGSSKPTGAPVKIGFIVPLSGPVAAYGAALKHAPAMVVKDTNSSGGINGSPLELVTVDSPNNPNQAITAMRRLANEDKVFAILGPYYTGEMQAAVPIAGQLQIPAVAYTTAASHPGVVEPNKWAFLSDSTEEITVVTALDGFKKVYPNVKKMVIVGDLQTAVTALVIKDVWPKVLPQKGHTIVDTITFQFNTADFTPIATRIKASGAEGIALSALSPAGPNLLKELEREGTRLPVVTSSHLQTVPPLPQIVGATADGLVQAIYFNPDDAQKPKVKEWLDKYEKAVMAENPTGEKIPIGYANEVPTYDVTAILVKAMRDAGIKGDTPVVEGREKIREALLKIKDFPGILRTKEVKPNGRITWDYYPLIARGGKYELIK